MVQVFSSGRGSIPGTSRHVALLTRGGRVAPVRRCGPEPRGRDGRSEAQRMADLLLALDAAAAHEGVRPGDDDGAPGGSG